MRARRGPQCLNEDPKPFDHDRPIARQSANRKTFAIYDFSGRTGGEATASFGAFGRVGCYEPVVRNPDSRDSFKQMPVAGHAFEWSPATILEADTGTGNEIPDGA